MAMLKSDPPEPVRSLEELLAIAHAMEHEAATLYSRFAEQARADGAAEIADLFEKLSEEERGHEQSVVDWSLRLGGKAPEPARIRWEPPETFDVAATGELAASRLATPYRILSQAVRNEERAFALWSHIAALAPNPEIRGAAERMAMEELGHVALLRRARREAYHADRSADAARRRAAGEGWRDQAGRLEHALADHLTALAGRLSGGDADRARRFAAEARAMSAELAGTAPPHAAASAESEGIQATAERLVEIYLATGDLSQDEAALTLAQSMAMKAIPRLDWLRSQG